MKRLEMITMRLGDLDKLKQELILDYAYAAADIVDSQPTIEPENLPVVKELREQLEAEKNKVIKIQYDCEEMTIKQICDRLRYAEQKLEEVTAEMDAAVRDMHHNTKCFICAHLPADGNMSHCKHYASCGLGYIHWKWRYPQKEK